MVQVFSHERHRQDVFAVTTFASVSTARPWQNGHSVGLATVSSIREPGMVIVMAAMMRSPTWPTLFTYEQILS